MKAPIQTGGEVRYFPKPYCLIVWFFFLRSNLPLENRMALNSKRLCFSPLGVGMADVHCSVKSSLFIREKFFTICLWIFLDNPCGLLKGFPHFCRGPLPPSGEVTGYTCSPDWRRLTSVLQGHGHVLALEETGRNLSRWNVCFFGRPRLLAPCDAPSAPPWFAHAEIVSNYTQIQYVSGGDQMHF